MGLALRTGDLDEVLCLQARRSSEQGAGDRNVVVSCEHSHDPGWRGVDRSQVGAQASNSGRLHVLHEPAQDVVEQLDLRVGMAPGSAHEQVCDGPEQLGPLSTRPAPDRELETASSLQRLRHCTRCFAIERKPRLPSTLNGRPPVAKPPLEVLLTSTKLKVG
jgi:hypothetical protein